MTSLEVWARETVDKNLIQMITINIRPKRVTEACSSEGELGRVGATTKVGCCLVRWVAPAMRSYATRNIRPMRTKGHYFKR